MNLYEFYEKNDVSMPGLDWLGDRTPSQFWKDCERPEWFLWLPLPSLSAERQRCAFIAADLACRQFAPNALEVVGLVEHAASLRALPEVVDIETAVLAEVEAARAAEAARTKLEATTVECVARFVERAVYDLSLARAKAAYAAQKSLSMPVSEGSPLTMDRLREVITLDKFIAACAAVGIETAGNARCAKSP
jgi:hypothetical protein